MPLPRVIDSPPHVPSSESRELVLQCVAFGLAVDEIALIVHCSPFEVKFHYPEELRIGLSYCNARVGSAMLKAAVAGDVNAGKFWLRARAGWRDVQAIAPVTPDGKPLPVDDRREIMERVLAMLTPEQVAAAVKSTAQQPESHH